MPSLEETALSGERTSAPWHVCFSH